ncbi:FecR domain-containing protein [Methyloversatilis thermotolerans]|uniref:FecR domain-containing protein n=1 Tax=Methyloversatilis thermotolerans TaxID=1346290 RepID=UPI001E349A6F|nr:FecR domain-containing protein [Methyloversatilis thermotolerans]
MPSHSPRGPARALGCLVFALLFASSELKAADFSYEVKPGDNPWNLTQRYLKDLSYWPRIQRYNQIREPRRLKPGSVLKIPEQWLRLQTREVRIDSLRGDVLIEAAGGRRAAVAGEKLDAGVRLVTGEGGSVALAFADGSRVQLRGGSEMSVLQSGDLAAGAGSWVRLHLLRGSLESLVAPRGGPMGRFEIETPAAVAAVRGTHFRVHADDAITRNEVLEGRVDFGNDAGRQLVAAGRASAAGPGRPAAPPVELLAPPRAAALKADRVPLNLPFAPLAEAASYRIQIAQDAGFDTVLSDLRSTRPAVVAKDLPDGDYRVRARGVDAAGFEGRDGEWALTVDARPEPPVMAEPAPDARVSDERPQFRWSRARPDERWRLQIADNPAFDSPRVDRPALTDPAFRPDEALAPGTWYWRVASGNPDEGVGPFSDAQTFRRPQPGPALEAPEAGAEGLSLRWRSAGEGMRYQIQIARSADFAQPEIDAYTDEPAYLLRDAAPGTIHLRVRSFASDGFAGDWAPTQAITVPEPPPTFRLWWLLPLLLLI